MPNTTDKLNHPSVLEGLTIAASGSTVVVARGRCEIGGRVVRVSQPARFEVASAPRVEVKDAALKLSPDKPESWHTGTRLQGPLARDICAKDALIADSLVLRASAGGPPLVLGNDYLLAAEFAMIGLGPNPVVTAEDTVFAGYAYSRLRLDALFVTAEGEVILKQGEPDITTPLPPAGPAGALRLANIYRPYGATAVSPEDIYPLSESAEQARTGTTSGRLPKTLAKLRSGASVTIVCWGDSVTAGGNASAPQVRYVDVFEAGLRSRFPQADLCVLNISVGGSQSRQWFYPETCPPHAEGIDFERVRAAAPDLVTVEFVNDAYMGPAEVETAYDDILNRFAELNAECVLIAPHFTHPAWMALASMRDEEKRPYVLALKAFAEKRKLALADASSRWAHLWQEGIPFLSLLDNSVNHPDDRGHRLFAEELWKCFAE